MKLDDNFLEEVGLSGLPEAQKQAFLDYALEQLESRVGEKMSEGLNMEQLREFDGIMKNDRSVIQRVISRMGDSFRQDELYYKLLDKHQTTEWNWEVLGEYLSIKWIQHYRPNYRQIVDQTLTELKEEIRNNAPQILAGTA